ncbi:MAG: hypothetical protein VB859_02310 [Planctomycetaceae bacterium]
MRQSPIACHCAVCIIAVLAMVAGGCSSPESSAPKKKSVFKQRTQEVGEFDAEAGKQVSDSKVRVTSPLLGGLEAYGPLAEKVAKLGVDHSLNLFYATNGRYPKNHDEFMREIIKRNNMQLPKLPYGARYEYDVANHKLVVVKAEKKANTATKK